jgi:hypothetical protein
VDIAVASRECLKASITLYLEWMTQPVKAHNQQCHSEPGCDRTERPIEYKYSPPFGTSALT